MIEIKDKDMCCGCYSCYNACPQNAIGMIEDEKGFKYPNIDREKCIDCGSCEKKCPILNRNVVNSIPKAYACLNDNLEERTNSSSGGVFIIIAKEIIKRNGVVFGACFDDNFNVIHSYAEDEKQLCKMMGSKYVQSKIGDTYKRAKDYLNEGRYVFFTGTPCQIEGLVIYLNKKYDKLFTQDIVCHGVPSPKVWNKYKEYQQNKYKEQIRDMSFRHKAKGWTNYQFRISFDTKEYKKSHSDDIYMKSFLKNICLRDSCYNCHFKTKNRISDITLADYWGISKIHPDMMDDKGISLVVINTQKGNELFNCIKDDLKYIETDLDEAIEYNSAMVKSVNHHKNEEYFFKNLDKLTFDKLVKKCIPNVPLYKRLVRKIKKKLKK